MDRRTVCIEYPVKGMTELAGGARVQKTKLLTVGSAFVNHDKNGGEVINGHFLAVPPRWNGRFVLMLPLDREEEAAPEITDDDIPL